MLEALYRWKFDLNNSYKILLNEYLSDKCVLGLGYNKPMRQVFYVEYFGKRKRRAINVAKWQRRFSSTTLKVLMETENQRGGASRSGGCSTLELCSRLSHAWLLVFSTFLAKMTTCSIILHTQHTTGCLLLHCSSPSWMFKFLWWFEFHMKEFVTYLKIQGLPV